MSWSCLICQSSTTIHPSQVTPVTSYDQSIFHPCFLLSTLLFTTACMQCRLACFGASLPNYVCALAGISPTLMKGVTTTLAQIQQRILQYIGPDTFLVGHSLENDLRVMKLVHLKNLDTAIMYPHARVRPHLLISHHACINVFRAGCHQKFLEEHVFCTHGTCVCRLLQARVYLHNKGSIYCKLCRCFGARTDSPALL